MKILLLILILLSSKFIYSQDEVAKEYLIEEIKIESLKVATDIFDSPVRISILDKTKINSFNGDKLSDVLNHTSGFYIKNYGGGLSLQTISLNGLSTEQTLVLVDGQKMNSNQNSISDLSLISKSEIEKIEVINSGASAIYGSDAIAGVVNITTTKGKYNRPLSLNVEATSGSYGYGRLSTGLSFGVESFNLYAAFIREYAKNDFNYFFLNGNTIEEKNRSHSDYNTNSFYFNLNYKTGIHSELSLKSKYISAFRNLPGIESGNVPSKSNQTDENFDLQLDYSYHGKINFHSQTYFQNYLMKYILPSSINDFYKIFEVKNISQVSIENFTGGVEAGYSTLNSGNISDFKGRIKLSGFLSSVHSLGEKFKIYPSVRIDNYSDIDQTSFTAKTGFNYKPFSETDFNIRINAGKNFRAPTFNDLYWNNSGNLNLKPEKSYNLDAGFIYGFNFLSENIFNFSFTFIDYRDRIIWIPGTSGLWRPENVSGTESYIYFAGLESKIELSKNLFIGFSNSITLNKAIRTSNDELRGKRLSYVPLEQYQSALRINFKNIGLNLFYSLIGKRYSDQLNRNALPVTDILDGNINYSLKLFQTETTIRFEVNNILNADYQMVSGYPMPLRNFKLSLKLNYK